MTAGPTLPLATRRVRTAELDAAGAVTEAAYEPFLLGMSDPYRAKLGDARTRDREAEVWVAVPASGDAVPPGDAGDAGDAGEVEVLGTVTLCPPGSTWRELARDDEGELRMLAVAPAAQGRGVGRALLETAIDRARADGAVRVVLSSLTDMHAAHRLYERRGFVRTPERDWSPVPGVQLVAYALELAS